MKSSKLKYIFLLWVMLATAFVYTGCEKDDDSSSTLPPSGNTYRTTVVGTITDNEGKVVIGATVRLGTLTSITDGRGNFFFTNADVPKDRMVFTATKSGFFKCIKGTRTQNNVANYVKLVMQEMPAAVNVNGGNGGVVTLSGGATITYPQNAFVDKNGNSYTGTVKVFARHINPAAPDFESMVPGGDLIGVNALGQTQVLYSLGMIEALLKDNSGLDEIKLAPGKTAELKMPIDPSQSSSALSTIPMWYLDENTAKWVEEGQATKSGNYYITTVQHFSTWNCDYSGPRADIKGKVVDCTGSPVTGIVVTVNNFLNVVTDNAGNFTTWVPVGYLIECQVLQQYNPWITGNSPVQSVTAVGGVINIIPPLVIPCATRLVGSVKTCGGSAGSPGYVYTTWNGGSTLQYTEGGNFELYVPENTEINITASFSGFSGTATKTTGNQGSVNTVAPIQLCGALPVYQNRFTIVSSGTSTTYVMSNIQSSTDFVDNDMDGVFDIASIVITGIANPGNYNCALQMGLVNIGGNTFPLHMTALSPSAMTVSMDSLGIWYYDSGLTASNTTENAVVFSDYGMPGGVASGTFEFDAPNGKIKAGEFSVIRNN